MKKLAILAAACAVLAAVPASASASSYAPGPVQEAIATPEAYFGNSYTVNPTMTSMYPGSITVTQTNPQIQVDVNQYATGGSAYIAYQLVNTSGSVVQSFTKVGNGTFYGYWTNVYPGTYRVKVQLMNLYSTNGNLSFFYY